VLFAQRASIQLLHVPYPGSPQAVTDAAQKAMVAPESAAALVKQGYDPHFLGPDQFAGFIASENARWSSVASTAGLLSKS
jgi:tripartite-type tricarboxylate transporter receptor subunit TctC